MADQVPHDGAWDGAGHEVSPTSIDTRTARTCAGQPGADEALAQIVEVRSKASASVV
jgi:hypothetical protein